MTRDETIQEVADRLGNRTDLNSKILKAMDYAQKFVMERYPILPWFLITDNLFTFTVAGQDSLQVPNGFLREVENGALWREGEAGGTPWIELVKGFHVQQRGALGHALTTTGPPTNYDIMGEYWVLAPVPDKVYTIYTRVYLRDVLPSELGSGSESNDWMKHEWEFLVAETVLRMGRHLQWDPRIASEFRKDRDEARQNFFNNEEARQHANRRYQMNIIRGT